MAIEIIENVLNEFDEGPIWAIWIEITDGIDTYFYPLSLSGTIAEIDLQAEKHKPMACHQTRYTISRFKKV
jgi:hypothetical protein